MVYNSKTEYYEKSIESSKSTFSEEILKNNRRKREQNILWNDKYFMIVIVKD
jgi:hypothetical protein